MKVGRPKTKVNQKVKVLKPKYKVKLDDRTIVYVRSLDIIEEVWRPLYPKLEVVK